MPVLRAVQDLLPSIALYSFLGGRETQPTSLAVNHTGQAACAKAIVNIDDGDVWGTTV